MFPIFRWILPTTRAAGDRFSAIVDGTSGDTYLQPVKAKLGESQFTCSGEV